MSQPKSFVVLLFLIGTLGALLIGIAVGRVATPVDSNNPDYTRAVTASRMYVCSHLHYPTSAEFIEDDVTVTKDGWIVTGVVLAGHREMQKVRLTYSVKTTSARSVPALQRLQIGEEVLEAGGFIISSNKY